jgi:hypothetical protein
LQRLSSALSFGNQDSLGADHFDLAACCPETRSFWPDGPSSGPPRLVGYWLVWASALSYCVGLFSLAVLPAQGVAVPRWLILAYGIGCALVAVLGTLLSPGGLTRETGGLFRLVRRRRRPVPRVLWHAENPGRSPGGFSRSCDALGEDRPAGSEWPGNR